MGIRDIEKELQRISQKGSFSLQTQSISILISSVRRYVDEITEEKKKLAEKHNFERMLRQRPETPEQEEEHKIAHNALEAIKRIERNISEKESSLRDLEKEVQSLLTEIRQAHKR